MKSKLVLPVIATLGLVASLSVTAADSHNLTSGIYVRPEAGVSNFQLSSKLDKAFSSEKVDLKQLKKTLTSSVPTGGLTVGKRFGELGVELGYSMLRSNDDGFLVGSTLANDSTNTDTDVDVERVKEYVKINNSINNVNLDANYSFHTDYSLSIKPSVGIGYMHSKLSVKDTSNNIDQKTLSDLKRFAKNNVHDLQPRAGISAEYAAGKNISLNSGVSYQMANNFYKGVTTVKAGFELTL